MAAIDEYVNALNSNIQGESLPDGVHELHLQRARHDHQVLGASGGSREGLNFIDEENENILAAAVEVVKVKVAMDSGAVANVIFPAALPADVQLTEDDSESWFVGAGGGRIRRYGSCKTKLHGAHGEVGCGWKVADVTRALHSVATVCGPVEAPKQDVLFCAGRGVVVPPGIVEQILKRIKPIVEYPREGNLYIAEMEMSSFAGQVTEA